MSKAAMQQALEVLEANHLWMDSAARGRYFGSQLEARNLRAISSLREAMEKEAQQKPSAWLHRTSRGVRVVTFPPILYVNETVTPLFERPASPQQGEPS